MTTMIATEGLTKEYGGARGIRDVSLAVNEGEIFGFLGPNGAGKTTTIRTLMGLLRPTRGRATIGGHDCWAEAPAIKRFVGYLPSEFSFDAGLTGAQILTYLGNLRGGADQAQITRLADRLELDLGKRFREYSRGNKQKVGLVQAFMHRPRLLILDEPTGGLDPLNQQTFSDITREAHRDGATVFLSSHILPEVEHLCERVGIIREGQLIAVDQVATLKEVKQRVVEVTFPDRPSPDWFANLPGVLATTAEHDHTLRLTVQGDLGDILQVAAAHRATNLVSHEPSLEEIFMHFYTGDGQHPTAADRQLSVVGRQ
jgi:ABC-2 type transport system ATP-binding protein